VETTEESACSPGIQALRQRLQGFETEAGRLKGLDFKPRATDVFVVTSPKCGTTWLQQIVHQLRSNGNMEYDEISRVIPWLELASDQGQDLDAPQGFEPRAFKTHACYQHCPEGAGSKYIVVVRDPHDVAISFFSFFEGWFFQPGEVLLEEFVREFWLARGAPASRMNNASYFHHLTSWWPHRHREDVLFLFFEDLKEDLEGAVAQVSDFIGVAHEGTESAAAIRALACHNSTFKFMSEHSSHFDERLSKIARNSACGLPPDAGMAGGGAKVRAGEAGKGRATLSPELRKDIDAKWEGVVGEATGCTTYQALRDRCHAERSQ